MSERRPLGAQLALGVGLRDAATLEAFEPGANGMAVHWLRGALAAGGAERGWLWGGADSGRSHLLEGACHAAVAAGERAIYLDPEVVRAAPEAVLEGLESCRVVALDDVDALAGDGASEAALFDLCNRMQASRGLLLMAAAAAPLACGWQLPDLASRFAAATVFRLRALDDDGREAALRRRARQRGIDLSARTARYILTRFARDPVALFALLDDLDEASLSAQRRVTIPFVQALLDAGAER
ncbi:MAG TPA: DnaA regulatory inactivator Hda [Pseudomonadales bacterium]|nr:DnaA regulatory inactivator Hda [Pseudomonadales bacterium]